MNLLISKLVKKDISLRYGYYIVLSCYPPLEGHPPSLTTPPARVLPPEAFLLTPHQLIFIGTVFWPVLLLGEFLISRYIKLRTVLFIVL